MTKKISGSVIIHEIITITKLLSQTESNRCENPFKQGLADSLHRAREEIFLALQAIRVFCSTKAAMDSTYKLIY